MRPIDIYLHFLPARSHVGAPAFGVSGCLSSSDISTLSCEKPTSFDNALLLTPSPPTRHPALDLSSVESLAGPAAAAAAHRASKPQPDEEHSGAGG